MSTRSNAAHAGVGSVSHASCELLNSILDIKPTGIPFNGTGSCDERPGRRTGRLHVRPGRQRRAQINGGTIKAYAVATPERIHPCLTFRLPRRLASRPSRPRRGTGFLRRRERRRHHRQAERGARSRHWTMRPSASACSISLAMMGAGVPFGAKIPFHAWAGRPGGQPPR